MMLGRALLSSLILTIAGVSAAPAASAVTASPVPSGAGSTTTPNTATTPATDAPLGVYWRLAGAQQVVPGTVFVLRETHHHASDGTRSDTQFFQISSTGSNDVPVVALRAYHHAQDVMARTDPGCQIPWTLLAAIGRVESDHGRFGGAQLGADGVSRPAILGPRLDGSGAFAAIPDSDHGALDGDTTWDRAVGQMQFLPSTWRSVARDGDGDGVANPDDINDAALGAAVYLCGAGGSLADPAGAARAAFRYNHSDYYVALVLSFETGYQTGVFAVPTPPPPPKAHVAKKPTAPPQPKKPAATPRPKKAATPTPTSSPTAPTPTPTPTAKPKPKPSTPPAPTTPSLVSVKGTWTACGGGYCLGSTTLDLGPAGVQSATAHADFDHDGTTETNAAEFAGLVGQDATLQVEMSGGVMVVHTINGLVLRNADGSFA